MGKYVGRDSLEKGKYLANSYTAARVNVNTNYPVFLKSYFRSGAEILMAVCSFCIFSQESFLERGPHILMNWISFSVGDSFLGGKSTPLGLHLL